MIDADQTRAVDRLEVAMAKHSRAQRKLEQAELERARAVVDARATGMTTHALGRLMGLSHVRVVQLSKLAETGHRGGGGRTSRPDPSATARGASEPTPVGVLLARALEIPQEPPAGVVESLVAACPRAEPDPSATVCRRVGCREQVAPGLAYCPKHSRC